MLTKEEALGLVSKELQRRSPPDDPLIVVEEHTIEKAFGWVFFYNSMKFLDTGIYEYSLAGNGPVIVDKSTGTVEFYGSANPVEEIIKTYERKLAVGRE
jgi:hypothetical protein